MKKITVCKILALACVMSLLSRPLAWGQERGHTLAYLVEAALQNYSGLQAAEFERQAAHEVVSIRFGELLPSVSVSSLVGQQRISTHRASPRKSEGDFNSHEINLVQPLLARSTVLSYNSSEKGAAAADANYEAGRQQLIAEVALAFLSWHSSADRLDLLQKRQKRVYTQLDFSRQLADEKIGNPADVILIEARLGEVWSMIETAKLEVRASSDALLRLSGHYPLSLPGLNDDFLPPELGGVEERIAKALQNNPEIIVASERAEEARLFLEAAHAAHQPRMNFTARKTFGDDSDSMFYGLQFQVPLFNGFRTSAEARRALLLYEASKSRERELRVRVTESVRTQNDAVATHVRNAENARNNISLLTLYLENKTQEWLEGFASATEVLDAQEDLFNAQVGLRTALYGYFSSLIRLHAAEGTLNEKSLGEISGKFQT